RPIFWSGLAQHPAFTSFLRLLAPCPGPSSVAPLAPAF
ncbi:hypothetical protein CF336_g6741, partial [Tilletia laevis]